MTGKRAVYPGRTRGTAGKSFLDGANFIDKRNQQAFQIPGRDRGKREHMLADNIPFNGVEVKILRRIVIRGIRMAQPMEAVPVVGIVPVIQEKIVQQSPPDHCPVVNMHPQAAVQLQRQPVAVFGHHNHMAKTVCFPVLREFLHGLHQGERKDFHVPGD